MSAALGIGTVQFGLDYGIANTAGRTPPSEVAAILDAARLHRISLLDTAAAYGSSEAVLGQQRLDGFQVVTKVASLQAYRGEDKLAALWASLENSLRQLRVPSLTGLLCHDANDLLALDGAAVWRQMQAMKDTGLVAMIGASVYDGEQIDALLGQFELDIVQLPVSVLDQRLLRGGHLSRLKAAGVTVHARSAFLQGLLLMEPDRIPAYFKPIRPLLRRWHAAVADQGLTPIQGALAFLRGQPEIDAVIVGVVDRRQLDQCTGDFALAAQFDARGLNCDDPAFVNPACWSTACH